MGQQTLLYGKKIHILVGTPGRFVDHLLNTKGFKPYLIKQLVLDEVDRLLDLNFRNEINQIINSIPLTRRIQLFSATMTIKFHILYKEFLKNPIKIEMGPNYHTVNTLKQKYLFIPSLYKDCYLVYLLKEQAGFTTIIFTRTCNSAHRVAHMLHKLSFNSTFIHGRLTQSKRLFNLNFFKTTHSSILVSTDIASRGIDIPNVDLIINYDVPINSKDYVHRVGRTARTGRSGLAVTIITQYDIDLFEKIEKLLGKKIENIQYVRKKVILHLERVMEARKLTILSMKKSCSHIYKSNS